MENALTREQTLRSITLWPAMASFEEMNKGSIEVGKSADFVLLDTDIMKCEPGNVLNAKVMKTVLGGEMVYQAGD